MLVLKFGGTSMGSAERILASARIVEERAKTNRVSVVVSAVAGVSNALQNAIDECVSGKNLAQSATSEIRKIHEKICADLQENLGNFDCEKVMRSIEGNFLELERLLNGVFEFGECPATIHCKILGMGELCSAPIFLEVLCCEKFDAHFLDSRKFVFTCGKQIEGDPDFEKTQNALCSYRENGENENSAENFGKNSCENSTESSEKNSFLILVFPGFISSWSAPDGKILPGLLGRNGSDFSAAIIAYALDAKKVEFWTDVDGVFSADPRIVPEAILVQDMSYEEAMELSFFGSKILHPKTLAPLSAKGIEAWSLNSKNPKLRGSRIAKGPFAQNRKSAICGISCLKKISMISVSGTGMRGRTGIAERILSSATKAEVSVLLIMQSSSEYTISFCVRDFEAAKVCSVLSTEFDLEIREGLINPIVVKDNCAAVSVVGDAMIENRGVAGKFFDAMASQDINILAIAQGSSERCISCVIDGAEGDTAVRAAHRFFFNTAQTIEIFAFGAGTIGGTLLDQIQNQKQKLLCENVDVKVMAIATVDKMILNAEGLDLKNWRCDVEKSAQKTNLDSILDFVKKTKPLNPVFVDCTASYDLPERYLDILNAGMSIATPNKRANSMSMDFYRDLRLTANKMRRRFLYETNVGAGLPIIDTLQNLFKSGDRLTGFFGIMSGSLSFIFGKLDEGMTFSEAVFEAKKLRFTEPDPRDDLRGTDVARKALIIAREAGMSLELSDVICKNIFPLDFNTEGTIEEFLARLPQIDSYFAQKVENLKKQKKVLRMGASIENGQVSVGILEVTSENPLYEVRGGENAFVFYTERYNPIPLTIRGYGAGAGVTAAGVFGDVLRTVSFNPQK